jgi:eukaryotic-like serine/threonine-protein kinase
VNQLGGYIIRSELGRGGMATVYLAEETLSRRLVALKLLHHELTRSEDARRRFISEMQILTALEHPNIVRCYHCNDTDGRLMMALEYVRGGTVRTLLDAGVRVSVAEACRIALGVLAALEAAHTHEPPIIHRDLKPENILLGDDGAIKVADFGIAKMLGSESVTTTPHGTLQYMSPEQFEDRPVTASSDLYSLGIVLYELLTGQRPFLGLSLAEIIRAHHGQQPPPFPEAIARGIPPQLIELVFALLRKDPSTRPASAQVVRFHIARIMPPGPPLQGGMAHQPSGAWQPPQPPQPQYPEVRMDTIQLIEQFDQRRSARGRGSRDAAPAGEQTSRETTDERAQTDAASTSTPVPPRKGSARSRVSQFLAEKDPGGPVPVHPELQLGDYTIRVMVRNDLLEAQQGARIVADTLVNGVKPKVQIIRRPKNDHFEHWVLVGRFRTRSGAMAGKASLRPILNQGANHIELSGVCASLGPIVDGLRDCIPP